MNETKSSPEQRWNARVCPDAWNGSPKRGTACFSSYVGPFDVFFPHFSSEVGLRPAQGRSPFPGRFSAVSASVAIV